MTPIEVNFSINQIPVNLNDATTGHKLQGMSKDILIIPSFGYQFANWIYTVLSRVRKLSGLYLFKPLNVHQPFRTVPGLEEHMAFLRDLEERTLRERREQMAMFDW